MNNNEILREYIQITSKFRRLNYTPEEVESIEYIMDSFFFKLKRLNKIIENPVLSLKLRKGKWVFYQQTWMDVIIVFLDNYLGVLWLCRKLGFNCEPLDNLKKILDKYADPLLLLKNREKNKKSFLLESKEYFRNLYSDKKISDSPFKYRAIEDNGFALLIDGLEPFSWLCCYLGYTTKEIE